VNAGKGLVPNSPDLQLIFSASSSSDSFRLSLTSWDSASYLLSSSQLDSLATSLCTSLRHPFLPRPF
jgi:hypothetical protein